MSQSNLLSPKQSYIQRSNDKKNGGISHFFNSPSRMNIRSTKSRNRNILAQSSSNESKLNEYMKSVKDMYYDQMEKIQLSNEKSGFYETTKSPQKVEILE